jgi:hypothetical protein
MPESRNFFNHWLSTQALGDKLTAAFGATATQYLLSVGTFHALTESVSFFPDNIGWCF